MPGVGGIMVTTEPGKTDEEFNASGEALSLLVKGLLDDAIIPATVR